MAVPVGWGGALRAVTGRYEDPGGLCMMIELGEDAVSPFSYMKANNESTPYARQVARINPAPHANTSHAQDLDRA